MMTYIIQLLSAGIGSLGFGIVFNMRKGHLLWAALGGFLNWGFYLVFFALCKNQYLSGFLAAALTVVYAELMARIVRTPATVFVVVCEIPLVPGASLYRSMDALMERNMAAAQQYGIYALLFAASMAAGILAMTMLFNGLAGYRRKWMAP